MESSIEITITSDDGIKYTFEIEFNVTKGYISNDPFEPPDYDECEITGIKSHEYYVSEFFCDLLIDTYKDRFYDKIWDNVYR